MRSAARRYVADARSASKPQPSAQHRRRGERKGARGAREESARGDARRGGPEVVASNVTRRAFSFARASRDARVSARRAALAAAAAAPSSVARRNEIPAGARVAPRGIVPARAAASRSRVPAAPPSASLMAWPTRPDGRAKRPSPVEASVEALIFVLLSAGLLLVSSDNGRFPVALSAVLGVHTLSFALTMIQTPPNHLFINILVSNEKQSILVSNEKQSIFKFSFKQSKTVYKRKQK